MKHLLMKTYIHAKPCIVMFITDLKKYFIYLFLDRREGWEKERERNINVWLPFRCSLLDTWPATQACALDWDSNLWPFGSQASAQSTEPHQPGLHHRFVCKNTNGKQHKSPSVGGLKHKLWHIHYQGMLLSNKKEPVTCADSNIDESQNHYA